MFLCWSLFLKVQWNKITFKKWNVVLVLIVELQLDMKVTFLHFKMMTVLWDKQEQTLQSLKKNAAVICNGEGINITQISQY